MRKIIYCVLACLLLVTLLGACSKQKEEIASMPQQSGARPSAAQSQAVNLDEVDVDLTTLSSTMVYAEVYNIMSNPAKYAGRTIKVSGPYYGAHVAQLQKDYHFVIVEDATACCEQGLEFIWADNPLEDYPKKDAMIEITGEFSSYEEQGNTYYYIHATKIDVLS